MKNSEACIIVCENKDLITYIRKKKMILEKKKSARLQIIPISLFLFCSMSALSTVYSSPVKWVACICLLALAAFMSKTIKWNLSLNTPLLCSAVYKANPTEAA